MSHPVFLVEEGGCSFVAKARNIASGGGAIALVFEGPGNKKNINDTYMGDDGSGHAAGLKLPTVLIDHATGVVLRDWYLKYHPPTPGAEAKWLKPMVIVTHPNMTKDEKAEEKREREEINKLSKEEIHIEF